MPSPSPSRRTLAEAMVGDVLDALAAVRGLERVIAVTAEPQAAAAARDAGASVVHDARRGGPVGRRRARRGGGAGSRAPSGCCWCPGDCPALDPGEVDALLSHQGRAGVVIVPDRHGAGTNALLLSPPDVIEPSFGPGSFARHAARAHAAGTVGARGGDPLARARRRHSRRPACAARRAGGAPGRRPAHPRAARADAPSGRGRRVIELEALPGLPEVRPGDDLAGAARRRRRAAPDRRARDRPQGRLQGGGPRGPARGRRAGRAGARAGGRARQGPARRRGRALRDDRARARRRRPADLPHAPRLRVRQRGRRRLQRRRARHARAAPARSRRLGARPARPARLRDRDHRLLRPRLAPGPVRDRDRLRRPRALCATGAASATRTVASCTRPRSRSPTRPPRRPTSCAARTRASRRCGSAGLERHVSAGDGPGAAALVRPWAQDLFR